MSFEELFQDENEKNKLSFSFIDLVHSSDDESLTEKQKEILNELYKFNKKEKSDLNSEDILEFINDPDISKEKQIERFILLYKNNSSISDDILEQNSKNPESSVESLEIVPPQIENSDDTSNYEKQYKDLSENEEIKEKVIAAIQKTHHTGQSLLDSIYKNEEFKELDNELQKLSPTDAVQFINQTYFDYNQKQFNNTVTDSQNTPVTEINTSSETVSNEISNKSKNYYTELIDNNSELDDYQKLFLKNILESIENKTFPPSIPSENTYFTMDKNTLQAFPANEQLQTQICNNNYGNINVYFCSSQEANMLNLAHEKNKKVPCVVRYLGKDDVGKHYDILYPQSNKTVNEIGNGKPDLTPAIDVKEQKPISGITVIKDFSETLNKQNVGKAFESELKNWFSTIFAKKPYQPQLNWSDPQTRSDIKNYILKNPIKTLRNISSAFISVKKEQKKAIKAFEKQQKEEIKAYRQNQNVNSNSRRFKR